MGSATSTPLRWLLKGSAHVPPSSELRVRGRTRPGRGAPQPPAPRAPLPPADCSRQSNRRAQHPAGLMSALPRPAGRAGRDPPPDTAAPPRRTRGQVAAGSQWEAEPCARGAWAGILLGLPGGAPGASDPRCRRTVGSHHSRGRGGQCTCVWGGGQGRKTVHF